MNKLCTIYLIFISQLSFGQLKITGQVLDLHNNPLPGASISVVGISALGVADDTGVFFLTLPVSIKKGEIITLRISKVGYKIINKHVAATYLSIPIKLVADAHVPKSARYRNNGDPLPGSKAITNINNQTQNQPASVVSYGQTGGITANQVYLDRPARILGNNKKVVAELLAFLPNKNEVIKINCIVGDSEAFNVATQIKDYLKSQGYTNVGEVEQAVFFPSDGRPIAPQNIVRDKEGVQITIGSNHNQAF